MDLAGLTHRCVSVGGLRRDAKSHTLRSLTPRVHTSSSVYFPSITLFSLIFASPHFSPLLLYSVLLTHYLFSFLSLCPLLSSPSYFPFPCPLFSSFPLFTPPHLSPPVLSWSLKRKVKKKLLSPEACMTGGELWEVLLLNGSLFKKNPKKTSPLLQKQMLHASHCLLLTPSALSMPPLLRIESIIPHAHN